MAIAFCLLTLNAATNAQPFLNALAEQNLPGLDRLVIDSGSNDGTTEIFAGAGFRIHDIYRESFNHGSTRNLAIDLNPEAEIIIYMTQDAILANASALKNLVEAFDDPLVGAAFGRQLPTLDSTPIAAHARRFNYPPESRVKTVDDIRSLGLKTAFISNSFAAYRRSALEAVGGFPRRCIVSEDTYVAARMLLSGYKIAYCSAAQVYHSHNYSWRQEFQRYFDIGVFHAREPWVRETFGDAEGEGWRFLRSEIIYLLGTKTTLIPSALVRTCIKYLGFRAGLLEKNICLWLKRRLSMQKAFWDQDLCGMRDA